nr:hypothetical protein CFP56_16659 [Quercus suber]
MCCDVLTLITGHEISCLIETSGVGRNTRCVSSLFGSRSLSIAVGWRNRFMCKIMSASGSTSGSRRDPSTGLIHPGLEETSGILQP